MRISPTLYKWPNGEKEGLYADLKSAKGLRDLNAPYLLNQLGGITIPAHYPKAERCHTYLHVAISSESGNSY